MFETPESLKVKDNEIITGDRWQVTGAHPERGCLSTGAGDQVEEEEEVVSGALQGHAGGCARAVLQALQDIVYSRQEKCHAKCIIDCSAYWFQSLILAIHHNSSSQNVLQRYICDFLLLVFDKLELNPESWNNHFSIKRHRKKKKPKDNWLWSRS